jgi:hypothetical protein
MLFSMNKKVFIAITIVICAVAAIGYAFKSPRKVQEGAQAVKSSQAQGGVWEEAQPAADQMTAEKSMRELSVSTSYKSPAGEDKVGFTVVVDQDNVIIDVKTSVLTEHEISKKRQESFAAEIPSVLKGKKLSELAKIDRVGGSSLTTGAFNNSLEQLKAQL